MFSNYSNGVKTQRDAWAYNFSQCAVIKNMTNMIAFYDGEVTRFDSVHEGMGTKTRVERADDFINTDTTKISWTRALKQDLAKGRIYEFESDCLVQSLYRPFTKQWLYFDRRFNEMVYQMPRVFPRLAAENIVICVPAAADGDKFSALVANRTPDLNLAPGMGGYQCFPLYLYDRAPQADTDAPQSGLFDQHAAPTTRKRRDAITDAGLAHFAEAYSGETITKEDLFYYIYGLLHSPDYRERYADNLAKELPRIPRVKNTADFWALSKAGRALADLHLNYETVPMYAKAKVISDGGKALDLSHPKALDSRLRGNDERGRGGNDEREKFWRVEKMKVPKSGKDKDLTRLIYNTHITVTGVPVEAYDYVVNGKPALDWVIERQCVKTDKDSGIVNDANAWVTETMHNPRYPLELFLRVITVSLETMKIVRALPSLQIFDN